MSGPKFDSQGFDVVAHWTLEANGYRWEAYYASVSDTHAVVAVRGPSFNRWHTFSKEGFLSTGYVREKLFDPDLERHDGDIDTVTRLVAGVLGREAIHLSDEA